MCGFAGVIDLEGRQQPDPGLIQRMSDALFHRGPDEAGVLYGPGVGIGHRRLSIVGLGDGQQPLYNEDKTVAVVANGEFFDHIEKRAALEAKGHQFRTHSDCEIIVHLYEQYGEDFFEHLKGQFAFALIDFSKRRIILARDRVGICPLHWTRRGNRVFFGSEIKALLASGEVAAEVDPRGLDHMFTFFAMGTRRTMFSGIQSILPGHYLEMEFRTDGKACDIVERKYWDLDFPNRGDEDRGVSETALVDEFEAAFQKSVELRLRADVPVVSYLSGGVDSAAVLAMASRIRGEPLPSFTIGFNDAKFDETSKALQTARFIGADPFVVRTNARAISNAYPDLVRAADCPVVDTSCAALWSLAGDVHRRGYKVALTGEGADEALAGYVWFKTSKMVQQFDAGPFKPSQAISRFVRTLGAQGDSRAHMDRNEALMGGTPAQAELYSMVSSSRYRFYSGRMWEQLDGHVAYEDLDFDVERMKRWHPLNRSLYLGYKTLLAGLLLNHKGDRVAMANSVETRYPFLDEDLIKLCARVHPSMKLNGLRHDKYLLRKAAARWLPKDVALRPKAMFRAPFAATFLDDPPPYVHQLMSEESLRKTGYFDVAKVRSQFNGGTHAKEGTRSYFAGMGLATIVATQLWHHTYLGGGLCELPAFEVKAPRPLAIAGE